MNAQPCCGRGQAVVMVVDDDPDIRLTLTEVLEDSGYDVLGAANGEEALRVLRSGGVPCVVLLDLSMPIMNGFEFVAAQSTDPALAHIPVIVVSATANVHVKARELTVAGVLAKPIDLDRLLRTVQQYCG
ncbi:MAG: response regulator [Myxococcales bacterium]